MSRFSSRGDSTIAERSPHLTELQVTNPPNLPLSLPLTIHPLALPLTPLSTPDSYTPLPYPEPPLYP